MTQTRFLRDDVLDEMLLEIKSISDRVDNEYASSLKFYKTFISLTELYETNKIALVHMEDAIELLRKEGASQEVIDLVVGAALHIQLGIVNVHNIIKEDTKEIQIER